MQSLTLCLPGAYVAGPLDQRLYLQIKFPTGIFYLHQLILTIIKCTGHWSRQNLKE